jgi:integrase/recombinase XerD
MEMERINDAVLIQRFKEDCKIRNLSKHTIESYMSTLNLFSSFLRIKKKSLLELDRDILRDYISFLIGDGINYKTIENRFSTFSSFYDYAVYENLVEKNIVLDIRKRYLKRYKKNDNNGSKRKLVSIEEMSHFINMIFDIRTKAIAVLFAKTGIRLRELIAIDIDDINWNLLSIELKPTHKRSNLVVFFDNECAMVLKRWLKKRISIVNKNCKALFVSYNTGGRLKRHAIYESFIRWAEKAGLHNSLSDRIEEHFTPHCCRHWYTTFLRRGGMPRGYIKELRGDKRRDAMDIYDHIDGEELRKSYLAHIPSLGLD